ncbi:MAG: hypothetical protein JJ863_30985 [Deltaproteobacteria bacterium]|nr:hypothetical protein [Deltaproteobacteria bacterium]
MRQRLLATWGVLWVLALLANALYRLTPLALEPWLDGSMSAWQMGLYVGWAIINAYTEGWRGFHLRFSPRVVGRAFYLSRNPRPVDFIFALPFVMSLYHAQRRQKIVSYTFIVVLTAVILAVRALPQPWRGIIDGGVVVGLGLGALSILYFWVRGLRGDPPPAPDLPETAETAPVPGVEPI